MEYKIKKEDFKKKDIEFAYILFNNGDYLPISKIEIVDISVNLYDTLTLGDEYYKSFCPVVESGFIKLKLIEKCKGFYRDAFLYNLKEYNNDRVNYIKNRLCNEGDLKCISLFNDYNWNHTLYGNMKAVIDKDFLIIKFEPKNTKQSSDNENNIISLPEVNKSIIQSIDLDFENCEGVHIYKEEIVEMQLRFSEELCWGSENYIRQIESGYIKLKLDDEINSYRENTLFDELVKGKKGNKQIEKRLCGNKGFDLHDICHLYIEYECSGFGLNKTECIEVNDIRSNEELNEMERLEEKTGHEYAPYFLGGYCEKQDDSTILITFGKTAQKNDKCKKLLNDYSFLNK